MKTGKLTGDWNLEDAVRLLIRCVQGKMTRNIASDKISYASQIPWILNSSVKENILFGEVLDQVKLALYKYILYTLLMIIIMTCDMCKI